MTHAHKKLIEQWLDDPTIEFEQVCSSNVYPIQVEPVLDDRQGAYKFRIKPAPKPDVVKCEPVHLNRATGEVSIKDVGGTAVCRFVFDGETGKLKIAEVL